MINSYDLNKIKRILKIAPIVDRHGNQIENLPLMEVRIAARTSLVGLLKKDWETLSFKGLKEELWEHFINNNFQTWEEAFDAEGISVFNDNRMANGRMRINKITVLQNAPFNFEKHSSNEIIERKNSFNKKAVFKKMESSFTIMYEGEKGRTFKQVKLLDYARLMDKTGTVDFVEKLEGYNYYQLLDTHSYFYMPDEEENGIVIIKEKNKNEIFKKLYRLSRFSGDQVYFLPHTTTEPLEYIFTAKNKNKEIIINEYAASTVDSEYATGSFRMIKKFGIPVTIDKLGGINLLSKISL